MSRSQYWSVHTQPAPTVSALSGGNLTGSGTLYLALQGRNRQGYSIPSSLVSVAYSAGQQIQVTIPSGARAAADDIHSWVVSASLSNDPATLVVLAEYPGYQGDAITPSVLPGVITLSRDAHLGLSQIVANEAALPTGVSLVRGMRRYVTDKLKYYSYDPSSAATVDNSTVLLASPGRWVQTTGFSTYLTDQTGPGGCDRDIRDVTPDTVLTQDYAVDGSDGTGIKILWYHSEAGSPLPQGTRMGLAVYVSGVDRSLLFHGKLKIVFEGYANLATGSLDTAGMAGVGAVTTYQARKSNLILQKDLPDQQAYAVRVIPDFSAWELLGTLPPNSVLSIFLYPYAQAGEYSEAGFLFGDFVYANSDRLLVVPTVPGCKMLSGGAMVDRFSFSENPQTSIAGLEANTANQQIAINGNGAAFLRSGTIPDTEALRALVSTQAGNSAASPWSSAVALGAGVGIQVGLTYPSNGTTATIRSDYPDAKLAGLAGKAKLNAPQVDIYVQRTDTSEIRKFTGLAVVDGTTQTFNLTDWSGASVIGSVPAATSPDFCLFAPTSANLVANGSGSFPAASFRVAYAFVYPAGGTAVSKVSHEESLGCISTVTLSLAEIEEATKAVGPAVASVAALRAVPGAGRYAYQSRFVVSEGNPFRFYPATMTADNGNSIIKPDDIGASDPGRWVLDDASQILHGSGPPSNTLGENGDYYYDVDDDTLTTFGDLSYKGGGTWMLLANVRGPMGPMGNSFRLLDHNPLVSEGIDGDTAFNYLSRDLFERVSGAWILRQNLRDIDFKGNWSNIPTYEKDDAVLSNRDLWRSLRTNTGIAPIEGLDWTFLLPGGQDGVDGQSIQPVGTYSNIATYSYLQQLRYEPGTIDDGSYVYINPTPSAGNPPPNLTYWQKVAGDGLDGTNGINGTNAYSTLTAGFIQPAVGSNVVTAIANTSWLAVGANVFILAGGYYEIISVASLTSATLKNLGYSGNAAPGVGISNNSLVTPTGDRGAAGATGTVSAASAVLLQHQIGDPSTGADESALYVKTDGKAYIRAENDGVVIEIGAGSGGGSVDVRTIWLFG